MSMTFADVLVESNRLKFKGQRVVVLAEARAEILQCIHSSHIGVNGCIRHARKAVFYPGTTDASRSSYLPVGESWSGHLHNVATRLLDQCGLFERLHRSGPPTIETSCGRESAVRSPRPALKVVPFNVVEFRRFAKRYDFRHTTLSPHYPLANGRAEAAMKTETIVRESDGRSTDIPGTPRSAGVVQHSGRTTRTVSGSDYVRQANADKPTEDT